jgi:hypothetical protein
LIASSKRGNSGFLVGTSRRRIAVETAAAEEIQKSETFGVFLDGFPRLLGKAGAKPSMAFPQFPQRRRR